MDARQHGREGAQTLAWHLKTDNHRKLRDSRYFCPTSILVSMHLFIHQWSGT